MMSWFAITFCSLICEQHSFFFFSQRFFLQRNIDGWTMNMILLHFVSHKIPFIFGILDCTLHLMEKHSTLNFEFLGRTIVLPKDSFLWDKLMQLKNIPKYPEQKTWMSRLLLWAGKFKFSAQDSDLTFLSRITVSDKRLPLEIIAVSLQLLLVSQF